MRFVATLLIAVLVAASMLLGLVAVGTAASLRPRPRDLAPAQPTALAGGVTLPPYHQRADPSGRVAVAPKDRTSCRI